MYSLAQPKSAGFGLHCSALIRRHRLVAELPWLRNTRGRSNEITTGCLDGCLEISYSVRRQGCWLLNQRASLQNGRRARPATQLLRFRVFSALLDQYSPESISCKVLQHYKTDNPNYPLGLGCKRLQMDHVCDFRDVEYVNVTSQ